MKEKTPSIIVELERFLIFENKIAHFNDLLSDIKTFHLAVLCFTELSNVAKVFYFEKMFNILDSMGTEDKIHSRL